MSRMLGVFVAIVLSSLILLRLFMRTQQSRLNPCLSQQRMRVEHCESLVKQGFEFTRSEE